MKQAVSEVGCARIEEVEELGSVKTTLNVR